MVMIEAMSCGVAVVSSKTGGIVESIDSGINGFLADDFNSEDEFFHLISEVLCASNYKSICDAARKKICDTFALEKVASDLKTVYERLLS
jgi:glycosyltransferase involved in cell wall biosynthesis